MKHSNSSQKPTCMLELPPDKRNSMIHLECQEFHVPKSEWNEKWMTKQYYFPVFQDCGKIHLCNQHIFLSSQNSSTFIILFPFVLFGEIYTIFRSCLFLFSWWQSFSGEWTLFSVWCFLCMRHFLWIQKHVFGIFAWRMEISVFCW